MPFEFKKLEIPDVILVEPKIFPDDRGFFLETWHEQRYAQAGITKPFVQDNVSFSKRGVLRGLHFQHPHGQGKLVAVLSGEVVDIAVDIRVGSPTFAQWVSVTLSAENHKQLYVPAGFAHGFCVMSQTALFSYKCTDFYDGSAEGGLIWNDPELEIDWPIDNPVLSEKDAALPRLKDIPAEKLLSFQETI